MGILMFVKTCNSLAEGYGKSVCLSGNFKHDTTRSIALNKDGKEKDEEEEEEKGVKGRRYKKKEGKKEEEEEEGDKGWGEEEQEEERSDSDLSKLYPKSPPF